MQGNELAFILQKLLSWKPRYEIHRGDRLFAEMVKEWSWFNKTFTLDVPGPNDYTIGGSFWRPEYGFTRSGRGVAWVSKAFRSWTHTRGVEIGDGEDDFSILGAAIVIDQVLHDEEHRNTAKSD